MLDRRVSIAARESWCSPTGPKISLITIKTLENSSFEAMNSISLVKLKLSGPGRRYLGSFIGTEGTEVGKSKFVSKQVREWLTDIDNIIEVTEEEPHLAYAAYIYGICRKWNFLMRTTPNIASHLQEIEDVINQNLIPAIPGIIPDENTRKIVGLPARHEHSEPCRIIRY